MVSNSLTSLLPYRDVPGSLTVGASEAEGALTDRGLLVNITLAVTTGTLLAAGVIAVTCNECHQSVSVSGKAR